MKQPHAIVLLLCLAAALPLPGNAQVANDSTAISAAFVRFVVTHPAAGGPSVMTRNLGMKPAVAGWPGRTMALLRSTLSDAATALPDSDGHASLQLRVDSLRIDAAGATVWTRWSECSSFGLDDSAPFWEHFVVYSLVRSDSGWTGVDQRVARFTDGRCTQTTVPIGEGHLQW